jgi:hypothetical protein
VINLSPEWVPVALILCHALGDYYLQSDWMALNKGKYWSVAFIHAAVYTLPFLLLTLSPLALLVICVTHAVEDHYSLGRFIVFARNFLAPRKEWPKWSEVGFTGSSDARPLAITFWLYVVADHVLHLVINALAYVYL